MRAHYGSTSHQDARGFRNAALLGSAIGAVAWLLTTIFL
jgi:hypothetical protein